MYFLGIVTRENMNRGLIIPAYILCQHGGMSEKRSQWIVTKSYKPSGRYLPMVLVRTPYGHDDMCDFLNAYRTREYGSTNKKVPKSYKKKYMVVGGIFWFECDKYGRQTGPAIFVRKIPVKNSSRYRDGKTHSIIDTEQGSPYKAIIGDLYTIEKDYTNIKYVLDRTQKTERKRLHEFREPKHRSSSNKDKLPGDEDRGEME